MSLFIFVVAATSVSAARADGISSEVRSGTQSTELIQKNARARLFGVWKSTLRNSSELNSEAESILGKADLLPEAVSFLFSARFPSGAMWTISELETESYPDRVEFSSAPQIFVCSSSSYWERLRDFAKRKGIRRSKVTQTEAIMFCHTIRKTADELTSIVAAYEKGRSQIKETSAESEVNRLKNEVASNRQRLVELAGIAAIEKLDKELDKSEDGVVVEIGTVAGPRDMSLFSVEPNAQNNWSVEAFLSGTSNSLYGFDARSERHTARPVR